MIWNWLSISSYGNRNQGGGGGDDDDDDTDFHLSWLRWNCFFICFRRWNTTDWSTAVKTETDEKKLPNKLLLEIWLKGGAGAGAGVDDTMPAEGG